MLDADAELLSILQYVLLIEIKSSTPAHGAMFVLNTYIEIKKNKTWWFCKQPGSGSDVFTDHQSGFSSGLHYSYSKVSVYADFEKRV